jgi:ubiquinone biosynthesis protein
MRPLTRAAVIAWAFGRRGLPWTVYRDVVRGHLHNPHCGCRADETMARRARRLREALESLGPTFVKLGQFLSQRPDLLPPLYLEALAELQEHAPAMPFERLRHHLEEVCICSRHAGHEPRESCLHCRGVHGVFQDLSSEPLASASLAQVHRGVFRGEPVAVKILKPGVLDRLNRDLALLRRLRWVVGRGLGVQRNLPPGELVEEFRRRLLEEVNFENEALNLTEFRAGHPDEDAVRGPRVFWELERSDVLVMELVEGRSLVGWWGSGEEGRRLARLIAEDFLRQVFLLNCFHADPHPGNLVVDGQGRVVYLDFGAVGRLDPRTKRALLRLLQAIVWNDADLAVTTVIEVGGTDPATVELAELRAEISRIIQLYRVRHGARWADSVIDVARRHRIKLPRGILLYAKATLQTEALVKRLDPGFEMLPVLESMVLPIAEKEVADLAARATRELPRAALDYAELVLELPDLLRRWLDASEGGHRGNQGR